MPQTLLFPDPRPLVDRLGPEFFRQAPDSPGVYLMRDAADEVLYVGKAKSLRKRLAAYRVANPDRVRRRHLRMLRKVARVELQRCVDESAALAREADLLRQLRPRFNRAGTWPGIRRFVAWRTTARGLDLAVTLAAQPGWGFSGPLGAVAIHLRAILARLCWCAIHPDRGLIGMPAGWFSGPQGEVVTIPWPGAAQADLHDVAARLKTLFAGEAEPFCAWIRGRTTAQTHALESASREGDLEALSEFVKSAANRRPTA